MDAYQVTKALHIVFVASWFAGLFYLPRIYVNLAMETDAAATARLLLMARKLYRFMNILAIPALGLGLVLWLHFDIGLRGPGNGWMHAKLLLIAVLLGYHHVCGAMLKRFATGQNHRSHRFYRWFNELPVLIMIAVALLVVGKPF